ncbi:hypothetical protein HGA11_05295 [Mycolicibacterium septicum DSM 44393]|uniref:Uncharacterized protein n=1 Tax=Mycolicibacterium septicum DSM 44393 TaxID=1341646 RepID=A0A7X6RV70_9MYCO|nr:hypothetical protein [Mycolicibacterium septicum]NKZ10386.1 hypothetical protein [Mycolicibacterium septicum DSM 44393]
MLRAVVETFLDSLSEREFDAPLLAILATRGFYDIHYIHGAFEFGKDVIAKKKDPHSGDVFQYSIQSKAGNVSQSDWRTIRPQIEECEYNTRAHPSFDETLPRVAVLVTTGRLKGSAPIDAQEFKRSCQARGLAEFEIWDREDVLLWLSTDPSLGLTAADVQDDLIAVVSKIRNRDVTEPSLERFSRTWLVGEPDRIRLARASIEASILCNALRQTQRLDLAALMSLHLHRAAWRPLEGKDVARSTESESAIRLFISYSSEILNQVEPFLSDPLELLRTLMSPVAIATYSAACMRLLELLGLLALEADGELSSRASRAVIQLCANHPGSWRPPADQFAASLIPPVVVIANSDSHSAAMYLKSVSSWLLDRHDSRCNGLGLASLDENEQVAVERLLGGALESTELDRRRSSYVATVVLDLLLILGFDELYQAVLANVRALQIHPIITRANESDEKWIRGGGRVWPQSNIGYEDEGGKRPEHHSLEPPATASDTLLLSAVARSRHYPQAISELVHPV